MQSHTDHDRIPGEIADIINKYCRFLIVTHDFPDGDGLGSQIALYELLKNLNKEVFMVCSSEIPYQYTFLPNTDKIRKNLDELPDECLDSNAVCLCLDSADEKRFSFDIKMLKEKTSVLINIDHHLGNSMYGNINLVNPSKSATAEMIYELIEKYFKDSFNYNIAAGLYTGILTDTGRFQYENTSNNVHKVIGYLLEFGVQPSAVYSCIYENEPFERFGLIKLALRRIRILKTGDLIYSYVLQKDFKKLGLPFSANDGIIELLRTASGVKIAALIKQVGDNNFKVSLRSSDRQCSVADIAVKFGGGGHRLAAAYSQEGNLKNIIRDLISAIKSGSK